MFILTKLVRIVCNSGTICAKHKEGHGSLLMKDKVQDEGER